MDTPGVLALKRQLQRSFKDILKALSLWENHGEECRTILLSLDNLCEQFDCCRSAQVELTPLKGFPDLKARLLHKLSAEIEGKISLLKHMLSEEEQQAVKLSKQRQNITELYQRYSDEIDMTVLTERSELYPSIADMMEWLVDVDDLLSQQVCCKEFLFTMQYGPDLAEKLDSLWLKEDQTIINQIRNEIIRLVVHRLYGYYLPISLKVKLGKLDRASFFLHDDV